MKLRMKILSGFLILAIMLAGAGVLSIYELLSIGSSVNRLLMDNYKSIDAARGMSEALEGEDTGILLCISGEWQAGRSMIEASDLAFRQGLKTAQNNITVPNENQYVAKITAEYRIYRSLWMDLIEKPQTPRDLNWYFKEAHQASKAVRQSVEDLIALNDKAMFQTASNLYDRANRAIMPGIVAILSSLVFVLVFNFFIHRYVIKPIAVLAQQVKTNIKCGKPLDMNIETTDELRDLAVAVKELTTTRRRTL